ncbi:MAG TPA: ABC transporter substrate-binding protein [Candidatus Aquilonibacter sp.]
MTTIRRRDALAMLGAAGIFGGSMATAVRAQTEPTDVIRLGVAAAEVCSEAFYGVDKGFFRSAGVDVKLEWFTNPGAIGTAIAGNAIDVGLFDTAGLIAAHSRGIPFVLLANGKLYMDTDPTFGIIVLADSPVRAAKDVTGTFAVSSVNNIAALATMVWIDRNGGNSKRVKFVELPFPTMIDAVQRRTVDGAVPFEPWLSSAAHAGLRTIWPTNGIAHTFAGSCWVASRSWSETHSATVTRFIRAIYEAGRWANHNAEASIPIVAKYTKMAPNIIRGIHRGAFAESLDVASLQSVIDAAAAYGMSTKAFPTAEFTYRS